MIHNLFQAMHLRSPVPGFILHSPNSRVPSLTSTLSSCCCYSLIQEFPKSVSFHLPTLGYIDPHTYPCLLWVKCSQLSAIMKPVTLRSCEPLW